MQLELARVLGSSREVVRLALAPKKSAEPNRWITWESLPYARVLDLVDEQLFPGVPSEVLRPGAWQKLVWLAPNGGGRSLTGRGSARGLAGHTSAPRIADAALQQRGAFVRLGSANSSSLGSLPGSASPFRSRGSQLARWTRAIVHSPPIADVLDELLRVVPRDSRRDGARARPLGALSASRAAR